MPSAAERILVVESDPDISQLIARQALKPLGYDVKVMGQAAQAIEEALANPPDLIIANLNLQDLGGKDILAALSAQGVTAPLVVIAERGNERGAIQAFRLGAADALLWPARDAEVVRVVERAMQPTRSRRIRRQLFQQLEAAQEELKRRAHNLATVLGFIRALSSGVEQRQLFGRLLEGAMQVAEADIAWLAVRDEQRKNFILQAQRNLPMGWAKKLNQPLDDGLSSLVGSSGQPLVIHGQPLERFKVASLGKSAAVLPVKVRNEVIAVLVLVRKANREVEKGIQVVLEGFADLASISLLNSRLFVALEASGKASRIKQKDFGAFQDLLRASIDRLASLESGDLGELTRAQKQAVTAIRGSLDRLGQTTGKDAARAAPSD